MLHFSVPMLAVWVNAAVLTLAGVVIGGQGDGVKKWLPRPESASMFGDCADLAACPGGAAHPSKRRPARGGVE